MATHSSILAWKTPQTEEPGGLQPMGSRRVGHNWKSAQHSIAYPFWKTTALCILTNSKLLYQNPCNADDPSSIPGLGRSPGEGICYPVQYSWVSLVAQTVKNPPAIQETWVRCSGWEDPLAEGMATHSSVLAWDPRTEEPVSLHSPWGRKESDTTERLSTAHNTYHKHCPVPVRAPYWKSCLNPDPQNFINIPPSTFFLQNSDWIVSR